MNDLITVQFKLNIPVALKEALSEAADTNGRSLTSEINERLKLSIEMSQSGLKFTSDSFEQFVVDVAGELVDDRIGELRSELGLDQDPHIERT
jgi:hypothetical protein